MRTEDLARPSAIGVTSFHRPFKAGTILTPLEYRTRNRLQEAHRAMLVEHLNATAISLTVGYETPSQFSREYRATSAPHPPRRRPAAPRGRRPRG